VRTLQDLVQGTLRPMLKLWLDDNLPPLVERLVRAEIERLAVSKPLRVSLRSSCLFVPRHHADRVLLVTEIARAASCHRRSVQGEDRADRILAEISVNAVTAE
jgi:hypothetical protein